MVLLQINDSKIWNPMCKAAEILHEYYANGSVIIDLMMESPDLRSTELPEFFEYLSSLGVDCKKITVNTGNHLESYPHVNIKIFADFMYELTEEDISNISLAT